MKLKPSTFVALLFGSLLSNLILFSLSYSATAYPAGTLVRALNENAIYYIANDGKKYYFPNVQTYKTWYTNFRDVRKISVDELKKIATGSIPVTARPGLKLLKFKDSAAVYAISSGAVIHPLSNPDTAAQLYGREWRKFIIHLPKNDAQSYVLGDIIKNNNTDYDRVAQAGGAFVVDDELRSRGIIAAPTIKSPADLNKSPSRLGALKENLSANFSPGFISSTTRYSLVANYEEETVNITPVSAGSEIKINGLSVASDKPFSLKLKVGLNEVRIETSAPDRTSTIYYLNIIRSSPEKIVYLKSLTEDLFGDLNPSFASEKYQYTVQVKKYEENITLKPESANKNAKIYINGVAVNSAAKYSLPLNFGDNNIRIDVIAEGSTGHTYYIKATRSNYPSEEDAQLSGLTISVGSKVKLSPLFDPNIYDYVLEAKTSDKTAAIKATPKNSRAIVTINGQVKNSLTVTLEPVNLSTSIDVEVRSPDDSIKKYQVVIFRY